MSLKSLYPAIETAYHALEPIYSSVLSRGCKTAGLSSAEFFLLHAAPSFRPDPISVKLLLIRGAYTSPEQYETLLRSLKGKHLLESVGEDLYALTAAGENILAEIMQPVHAALSGIQPLSITEMMDLASRLKDCADACLNAPEPPGTWSIQHSRNADPGPRAPMMVRIEQFLTELVSFRDDAHLAAWKGYDISGHAWDILTLLWSKEVMSLEEINNLLKRRGNSLEQSRHAVDHLVRKGWVTSEQGVVRITPFGADIRKIAEETTNRYFYLPFNLFDSADLKQTIDLLENFRRGLPRS